MLAMDFTLETVEKVKIANKMQKDLLKQMTLKVLLNCILDQSFYITSCTFSSDSKALNVWEPFFNDYGIIDREKLDENHKKAARNKDNKKLLQRAPKFLKDKLYCCQKRNKFICLGFAEPFT